jgi:hypothetical protein
MARSEKGASTERSRIQQRAAMKGTSSAVISPGTTASMYLRTMVRRAAVSDPRWGASRARRWRLGGAMARRAGSQWSLAVGGVCARTEREASEI